ncbi:MAG: hypothetical protein Q9168_004223 [Polycauliona sp. 1 TL-2023]
MTEGSFVKIADKKGADEDALDGKDDSEPDVYDVNVLAWDTPVSPLHLAIIGGHTEVIKTLIGTFGADALLPIKIVDDYSRNPKHAIMTLVLAGRLPGTNALQVTRELLALGASSAQADNMRVSAFHYLVAKSKTELLKACYHSDGAATKGALNHLTIEDTYWRPGADTPLTTAIKTGNAENVRFLLDMSAKPVIGLDDFASAYEAAGQQRSYYHRHQDVEKLWKENVRQPILLAVDHDLPEIVLKLLDMGADINTLDKDAHESIWASTENSDKNHLRGNTLYDHVTSKLRKIELAISHRFELAQPVSLRDELAYLKDTQTGSYAQWYLTRSVEAAKNVVSRWEECRAKRLDEASSQPGKAERIEALKELKARFTDIRDQLRERGARKLKDLYPKVSRRHDDSEKSRPEQEKPFEPEVKFIVTASEEVLAGYLQLFEAAWEGDIEQIKALTLAPWGPDLKMKPLHVSTADAKGFTPFAIALYRRHFATAKTIIGIANAQFKDPEDDNHSQRRYAIASEDESSNSDDSDSDNLDITYEIVDNTYSYDNVAALQESVGSRISEKEALKCVGSSWNNGMAALTEGRNPYEIFQETLRSNSNSYMSLSRYAIVSRDMEILRCWLQCCQEAMKMKGNSRPTHVPYDVIDLKIALERGFVEEVAELIKNLGAELPLDALIKKSGVEKNVKPKYYQGLSIGGKKMTGWAREHGGHSAQSAMSESTPPVLQAAHAGGLAAVEWFMSDTPLRLYREYRGKHKDDERLQKLAEAPGGYEQVVGSWLKQRNNLAIHAAVLSEAESEKSLEVVNYLIAVMPDSIDLGSVQKLLTPLALAFVTGKVDAARALIKAGADQTTRDSTGKNLVHMALIHASQADKTDTQKLKELLNMIDKRVVGSLFTERCKDGPGGLTPLALWLAKPSLISHVWYGQTQSQSKLAPETFHILQEYGGGEPLRMMDGSGQFPLHVAVKSSYVAMVKLILDHDPALLATENAMGQTPLELAHSLYVRECAKGNPEIRHPSYTPIDERKTEDFAAKDGKKEGEEADEDENNDVTKTWELCKAYAEKEPRKRKLVSVNEAREVAKRLADTNKQNNERMEEAEERRKGEQEDKKGKPKTDEIVEWAFGKRMTPAQRLRKHQRALEKTQRELDRERVKLENQEKKLVQDIKKSAKNGQMGACKIQAKDLVRTRRYIDKFYAMRTQLQAISLRIQTVRSNEQMMQSMKGATSLLGSMNRQMNLPALQRIAMEFEKENDVMDQRQEMMDDAIDDVTGLEDEEEGDEVVNKVLDEIGVDLGQAMGETPTALQSNATPNARVAEAIGGGDAGDDDLQARLDSLRR